MPVPSVGPAPEAPATHQSLIAKLRLKLIGVTILLTLVALGLLAVLFQNKMIYFPSRYGSRLEPGVGEGEAFHAYRTNDGHKQWGYLIEPGRVSGGHGGSDRNGNPESNPAPGPRFYLVFNGNASTALDVAPFFETLAGRTGCGFFIADYRGYGFNGGRPNESHVVADALSAYDSMKEEGRLGGGVGVIGHSLGAGAAFALALERDVDRLITLSAFTSIDAMARRIVPWPLYLFLLDHYPNDRRLAELLEREPNRRPDEIVLMHGRRDEVIPFSMGERLAEIAGERARFIAYDEAHHNDIHSFALGDLVRLLN